MEKEAITFWSRVERHHPDLPRYLIVPSSAVAAWKLDGTTVIEGTLNGTPLGRRSLKRWDDERWFIDLPEKLCREASVDEGDRVELKIRVASTELPPELASLLSASSTAKKRWSQLTPSRRRMIREHVAAAMRRHTRERRARRSLGLADDC